MKSALEAVLDLLLNNNMAELIGLNLNLKKIKSTVLDPAFKLFDEAKELVEVGLFHQEKSVDLAGQISRKAAEINMNTVDWIAESAAALSTEDVEEAKFLAAFGEATRMALWPVVTLTFSTNVAVAEAARANKRSVEKIFEHLEQLLKIFEGNSFPQKSLANFKIENFR